MNFWTKSLLASAVVIVAAISIGELSRLTRPPPPAPSAASVDSPAGPFHLHRHHPADPMEHALALLRTKLRPWQDSRANDPDDDETQDQLMKDMLDMLTDENVAQIVQSLSADELNTPFGIGALHRWMQADPLKATEWLAARPETTEQQTLAVADDWAAHTDKVQNCLDQLPASEWKQKFLNDLSSEIAVNNPQDAIKLAQQMDPGAMQTNLLQSVACTWVSSDPAAALDWVAGLQNPALREQLAASAIQSYALTDPVQAATWLSSEIKSDRLVKSVALNIVESWAMNDPAAAADWVAQFPEGSPKNDAVQIISKYWRQTDPPKAAAWLQKLGTGSAAD